jgi:hypothetical protein
MTIEPRDNNLGGKFHPVFNANPKRYYDHEKLKNSAK